jgi:spoIIIJ-associated protein
VVFPSRRPRPNAPSAAGELYGAGDGAPSLEKTTPVTNQNHSADLAEDVDPRASNEAIEDDEFDDEELDEADEADDAEDDNQDDAEGDDGEVDSDEEGEEDGELDGEAGRAAGAQKSSAEEDEAARPSETELFRQSEIAADYIEGLLDILDFDGDIDELVQNGRPMVEVVGARLNVLVGTRGATLEALQELSRLAVYRQTGEPSRLLLDVGGFRAARRKELAAVARNAAEKVRQHGEAVRLEPMTAFERKCVHDVINAMTGVESESEGVEPNRRIVVRSSEE